MSSTDVVTARAIVPSWCEAEHRKSVERSLEHELLLAARPAWISKPIFVWLKHKHPGTTVIDWGERPHPEELVCHATAILIPDHLEQA